MTNDRYNDGCNKLTGKGAYYAQLTPHAQNSTGIRRIAKATITFMNTILQWSFINLNSNTEQTASITLISIAYSRHVMTLLWYYCIHAPSEGCNTHLHYIKPFLFTCIQQVLAFASTKLIQQYLSLSLRATQRI